MADSKLENGGKKTSWVYPEVQGANPPERWGHSACFSESVLYVFGGCRGGLHFSDVMSLDFKTMSWSTFACTGQQPGTRDSHTAVLHGRKMIIFGGTNGSKKINDVHILDLDTHVWSSPAVEGQPPPPRESHSATLVDGNKVVIFGGTGEGEGNYLNDIHFLELDTMKWVSPAVKGELPVCRDSHTAVAIKDQLIVYGGDCGDRYLGELDMFNLRTFTWSKIETAGSPQPGVRAGHVAVGVENKVYIFGGVGDRAYYNDVWILDINSWTWSQLEAAGLQPQGRFSHVAVLRDDDIAIYGGCGEDERPLDEFIVLHLGIEQLNPDFPKCKFVQTVYDMERRRPSVEVINDDGLCDSETKTPKKVLNLNKSSSCQWKGDTCKTSSHKGGQATTNQPPYTRSMTDMADSHQATKGPLNGTHMDFHRRARARKMPFPYMEHLNNLENSKRRKTTNLMGRMEGVESEQDEPSPTMSQHPSPTLSDQDRVCPVPAISKPSPRPPTIFLQHQQEQHKHQDQQQILQHQHSSAHPQKVEHMLRVPTLQLQLHLPGHQTISLPVHETPVAHLHSQPNEHFPSSTHKLMQQQSAAVSGDHKQQRNAAFGMANLVGSEVRGIVDGAFDSGYLMTAQLNGQVFRGVLFSPGPMHAAVHRPPQCNAHPKASCQNVVMPYPSSMAPPAAAHHVATSMNGTLVGYPVHLSEVDPRTSDGKCPTAQAPSVKASKPDSNPRQTTGGFHGVVIPAGANGVAAAAADGAALRPVQIMGGFPAVVAGQSGRWVWQPAASHSSGQPQQQQQQQQSQENSNLSVMAFPPIQSITFAPAAHAQNAASPFRNGVGKSFSSSETDLQPAVTLSLGGPGQSSKS